MHLDEQQLELNGKLYNASYKNKPDDIRELVQQGAQVNSIAGGGRSPLVEACSYGALEAVIVLLELGANPNFPSLYNRNPLMITIENISNDTKNRRFEIAKRLIEAGIKIDMVNKWGDSALHYAINKNAVEFVELLLTNQADPNLLDSDKITPLIKTIFAQVENKLDYILSLEECFPENAEEIIATLNINECNEFIRELNIQDAKGQTMLMKSVQAKDFHKVKKLIQLGADMNLPDNEGKTALFYANFDAKDDSIARYLVETGANVNTIFPNGYTVLILALKKKNFDFVKFLLQYNLAPEVINSLVKEKIVSLLALQLDNSTPAGLTKYTALFYLVICINNIDHSYKNKYNIATNKKYLHECLQILNLLLTHNADPIIRCDSNKTVFNICGDEQARQVLKNNILLGSGLQHIAQSFHDWFPNQGFSSDLVDITTIVEDFLIQKWSCNLAQLKRLPELKQLLADKYNYSFSAKKVTNFASSPFGQFSHHSTDNNNANNEDILSDSIIGNDTQTENETTVQNRV
ncbi:MAG: hypothetical protein HKM04_04800 [Legionellales bacterium]|nr:hypothetical protein [Legionellales bacterium]